MRFYLPLLALAIAATAAAQPTWRFHLAFEDGTGARDTMWFVYDTTATMGWGPGDVDYALGEGAVSMDLSAFNVWQLNWDVDTTKTIALPYSEFPSFQGGAVSAFNYVAPMIIRWDTSLFHASYLPGPESIGMATMGGEYFFFNNNHPELQAFDMLLADSVVVSTEVDFLFPIPVYFAAHDGLGVVDVAVDGEFLIQPNPATDLVRWRPPASVVETSLVDQLGRTVMGPIQKPTSDVLDLSVLPDGLYFLHLLTTTNRHYHARIIKQAHP